MVPPATDPGPPGRRPIFVLTCLSCLFLVWTAWATLGPLLRRGALRPTLFTFTALGEKDERAKAAAVAVDELIVDGRRVTFDGIDREPG